MAGYASRPRPSRCRRPRQYKHFENVRIKLSPKCEPSCRRSVYLENSWYSTVRTNSSRTLLVVKPYCFEVVCTTADWLAFVRGF
jgi:hypothetical protein